MTYTRCSAQFLIYMTRPVTKRAPVTDIFCTLVLSGIDIVRCIPYCMLSSAANIAYTQHRLPAQDDSNWISIVSCWRSNRFVWSFFVCARSAVYRSVSVPRTSANMVTVLSSVARWRHWCKAIVLIWVAPTTLNMASCTEFMYSLLCCNADHVTSSERVAGSRLGQTSATHVSILLGHAHRRN